MLPPCQCRGTGVCVPRLNALHWMSVQVNLSVMSIEKLHNCMTMSVESACKPKHCCFQRTLRAVFWTALLFVILRVGKHWKNKVSQQGCQAKFAVTLINIQANVFQMLLWITFPSFLPLLQSSCWLRIFTFVSDLSCLHFIAYDCYCLCLFYPLRCVSFS